VVPDHRLEHRRVSGLQAEAGGQSAHHVYSYFSVVSSAPLADVVHQGPEQKQVRARNAALQ
jgi:hypothetical protein